MSYELLKPYTDEQRFNFVVLHNHENGRRIEESNVAIYALELNERWNEDIRQPEINPNYEQEQAEKELERVNNLTMTALDFITFLQTAGLTLEQINAYLEANLEVKMQLTYCQNVYCGVAKSLMPITLGEITITAEMVENAFKTRERLVS